MPDQLCYYSYLDRSKYIRQLRLLFEYCDHSRCLICLNADLRYRLDDTMASIFKGLSVDGNCSIPPVMIFAEGGDIAPTQSRLRSNLVKFYANQVKILSELLDRDLTAELQ